MQRIPEPELMDKPEQARAYAEADFSAAHDSFVASFRRAFPDLPEDAWILDLGCGAADVTIRVARALPQSRIDGLDGAEAMLALGRRAVAGAGLGDRIRLTQGYLPGGMPLRPGYDAVISNSLLHHLARPEVLWDAVWQFGATGARVMIMDLLRPSDPGEVERLVQQHAGDAPDILRRDFRNSLRAAYRPEEVRAQLRAAGLGHFEVDVISDRHFIMSGVLV